MADETLKRDQNHVTVLAGVTDNDDMDVVMLRVDPTTKRLLIKDSSSGSPGLIPYYDDNGILTTDSSFSWDEDSNILQIGSAYIQTPTSTTLLVGSATTLGITSNNNTAIGIGALAATTTLGNNTALGSNAGNGIINSSSIVAIGFNALEDGDGATGSVAVGSASLNNCDGFYNVGIGNGALSVSGATPVTGQYNVGLGYFTGFQEAISGSNNIMIGRLAKLGNVAHNDSIVLGAFAESDASNQFVVGANNTTGQITTVQLGVNQTQTAGMLQLDTLTGALIAGSSRYLNFNSVTGLSGYGIRDNGGTMEYKNSGGSWTAF